MSENIRQRKRLEESETKSDPNRGITLDKDDHRNRNRTIIPLS